MSLSIIRSNGPRLKKKKQKKKEKQPGEAGTSSSSCHSCVDLLISCIKQKAKGTWLPVLKSSTFRF